MTDARNITPHKSLVTKAERRRLFGHGACTVWLTGLSGSGKSTVAHEVERRLFREGVHSFVLDGDNVRDGLNSDLGFSDGDRRENIRRVSEVSRLLTGAGMVVLTAFISPFREDRERARGLFEKGEFFEVFVRCPMQVCEARDPKNLYAQARGGKISEFTGIDSPYEEPEAPDLVLDTEISSPDECADRVIEMLKEEGIIK